MISLSESDLTLGVSMDWIFKNLIHIYLNGLDLNLYPYLKKKLESRSNPFKWIRIWSYPIYIHLNVINIFFYKF